MIVYPVRNNNETTLEFEYWIDRFDDSMLDRIWTKNYRDGYGIISLVIFVSVILCILCCCVCGIYIIKKYFCNKHLIRSYELEEGTSTTQV